MESCEEEKKSEDKSTATKYKTVLTEDASRRSEDELTTKDLKAEAGAKPDPASDMLLAYADVVIHYINRKTPSTFVPSSRMMYYIIHLMNNLLCDSYSFQCSCPDYHPYILRLYCGILFWIQCLRVDYHTGLSDHQRSVFLTRFLDSFPPESLPVPGPLLTVFKTLCASQPELLQYGPVCPTLPNPAGPARRRHFLRSTRDAFMLPNVSGIFALLEHLNSLITAAPPVFPDKDAHIPVNQDAVLFGHHNFPAVGHRSQNEMWSLVSAGLEYPCEANTRLHKHFATRCESFNFPATHAKDNLNQIVDFLHMNKQMNWFSRVRDVVSTISSHFTNSRTLAECPVFGLSAGQYTVEYLPTVVKLPPPRRIADPLSLYPYSFIVRTSVRSFNRVAFMASAAAQTNVALPNNHPRCMPFGAVGATRIGDFWNFWPEGTSNVSSEDYLRLRTVISHNFLPDP